MQPVAERAEQFAEALSAELRDARRRRGLTQSALAARTGDLISQAAIANYETGHRSLRMAAFWVLAQALDVDSAELVAGAELAIGTRPRRDTSFVPVRVADVLASTNPTLAPVQRWMSIRHASGVLSGGLIERIDDDALAALANLMGMTVAECCDCLLDLGLHGPNADTTTATAEKPDQMPP
ncbi:MAG: helix-turn-helix domain-containing protein [Actinomycetota bacterium]|nr:helix-turn-helix domain-containing protein [Actinomycetota bacterium]